MPKVIRAAIFLAVVGISSQALACTYSARGRVHDGRRAWKFKVRNAPCVDQQFVAIAGQPTPPPMVYAAPPGGPLPMPVVANARLEKPVDDRPSLLAIKYAPGASSGIDFESKPSFSGFGFAHSLGLEVRLSRWFALRSDFEWRPQGRSWDMLGLKVWLIPSWALRPYASVSLSGSEATSFPGKYQLGVVAALGLDLMIGKHFFIEAEARYRVSPTSECCREVPTLTGLVGAGVAFF
jgi:hypothetical protein